MYRFKDNCLLVAAFCALLLSGCGELEKIQGPTIPYAIEKDVVRAPQPIALIKTSEGEIEVELWEDKSPNTVANFVELAESGFYNGLTFHRIIPNFCIQGGCPNGDGTGGPGYEFDDELYKGFEENANLYGTIAMANSGPNTNGSQFFFNINAKDPKGNSALDQKHTVFGKAVKGLEVLKKLEDVKLNGEKPAEAPKILGITISGKRDKPYKVQNTRKKASTPPEAQNAADHDKSAAKSGNGAKQDEAKAAADMKTGKTDASTEKANAEKKAVEADKAVKP